MDLLIKLIAIFAAIIIVGCAMAFGGLKKKYEESNVFAAAAIVVGLLFFCFAVVWEQ